MNLYNMIFKRKSFHIFKEDPNLTITEEELITIKNEYQNLIPLIKDIKTDIVIHKAGDTPCLRKEEYCIYLYSEIKNNYLQNIGYLGEQLDLLLTSMNIGTLWFGIGKPIETTYQGLEYVIMIAIRKVDKDMFRKDMYKSKRKSIDEIWRGDFKNIANIVRFSPSACNTQPWFVEVNESIMSIYRYKKSGKRGIMPVNKVVYYNRIDIGIFLLFLDLCLKEENLLYKRQIYLDNNDDSELQLIATYNLEI